MDNELRDSESSGRTLGLRILTKHIFTARLPDPGRSGGDRLPVRAGSRMVHLCPADSDSGRCHRRSCSGLLEGLVRTVVLAWALVRNATPDRVWIVLCLTVSNPSQLEQWNPHADVFHRLESSDSSCSPWLYLSTSMRLMRTGYWQPRERASCLGKTPKNIHQIVQNDVGKLAVDRLAEALNRATWRLRRAGKGLLSVWYPKYWKYFLHLNQHDR